MKWANAIFDNETCWSSWSDGCDRATSVDTPPGGQAAFPQIKKFIAPFQSWALPSDTWANSTEGFRLHTLVENTEITAFYWYGHRLDATSVVEGTLEGGQTLQARYPQVNDLGVTANRPIYSCRSV